jgi:hypothetical protein
VLARARTGQQDLRQRAGAIAGISDAQIRDEIMFETTRETDTESAD